VFVPPMAIYLRMLFYRLLRSVRGDYHHMSSVRDSSSSLQNCRNNVVELSLPPQEAEANADGSSVPIPVTKQLSDTSGTLSLDDSVQSATVRKQTSSSHVHSAHELNCSSSRGVVVSTSYTEMALASTRSKIAANLSATQSGLNNTEGAVIGRAPSAQWMAGLTALLVDDCRSQNKTFEMLLGRLGCKCLAAEDGAEALEIVRNLGSDEVVDFVLMDNYMPMMTGAETTQELRAMGYRGPIIGLFGPALPAEIVEFQAGGGDEVLWKPLNLYQLHSVLHQRLPLLGRGPSCC
jgi:CheY-like chemotaxis protein